MKKLLIIAIFLPFSGGLYAQKSQGIGTNVPNPRAVLDLNAESPASFPQGFLPPRLTTVQRTNVAFQTALSTTSGMTVFDTDIKRYFYWNGASWSEIAEATALVNYWTLTGNNIRTLNNSDNIQIASTAGAYLIGNNTALRMDANSNVFLGGAGSTTFPGINSIFIGVDAGKESNVPNNDQYSGVFIGHSAGMKNTGFYNTYVGYEAGASNTSGTTGTFFGYRAGKANVDGSDNTYMGYVSGSSLNGSGNTFYGNYTGPFQTSGSNNSYFGNNTARAVKGGSFNSYFGDNVAANTTGSSAQYNSFFGARSGYNNLGTNNDFFGFQAGYNNVSGANNVFIGYSSGINNTSGINNVALGNRANFGANNLSNAIAIGFNTTVSGSNSVSIGNNITGLGINTSTPTAMLDVNGGARIRALSVSGAVLTVDGGGNVGLGSLPSSTASDFTLVGSNIRPLDELNSIQLASVTSAFKIEANNALRMSNTNNVMLGNSNAPLGGSANNLIGQSVGNTNMTGTNNNIIGQYTGGSLTTGSHNNFFGQDAGLANTSGSNNNFIGSHAGQSNNTGSFNNFIGNFAGGNNTGGANNLFLGSSAGTANTTGSDNIAIGSGANMAFSNLNNSIAIGKGAIVANNNQMVIGAEAGTGDALSGVGISTGNPTAMLDVNGGARIRALSVSGSVLTVDGLGNVGMGNVVGSQWSNGSGNIFYSGGNVGIGAAASPSFKLDILGNLARIKRTSDTAGNNAEFDFSDNAESFNWRFGLGPSDQGNNFNIGYFSGSYHISLYVNPNNRFVGIGNPNGPSTTPPVPNHQLVVYGNQSVTGTVFAGTLLGTNLAGAAGSVVTVDGNGRLGIGTIASANYFTLSGSNIQTLGSADNIALASTAGSYLIGTNTGLRMNSNNSIFLGNTYSTGIGADNFIAGLDAGKINVSGSSNIFIGKQSGQVNNNGNNNNFLGFRAGGSNTNGSNNNFFGFQAGNANALGNNNNFMGNGAGFNSTGSDNTFFGFEAGKNNTSGSSNIFMGNSAGIGNTLGNHNILLGHQTNVLANNLNNAIAIGKNASVGGSNMMVLGGTGVDAIKVGIGLANPSEVLHVRSNTSVVGMFEGFSNVGSEPVNIKVRNSGTAGSGFIMQQGADIFAMLSNSDNSFSIYSSMSNSVFVNYNPINQHLMLGNTGGITQVRSFLGVGGSFPPAATLDVLGSVRFQNFSTSGAFLTVDGVGNVGMASGASSGSQWKDFAANAISYQGGVGIGEIPAGIPLGSSLDFAVIRTSTGLNATFLSIQNTGDYTKLELARARNFIYTGLFEPVQSGDVLGSLEFSGASSNTSVSSTARIEAKASQNFSGINQGTNLSIYNTMDNSSTAVEMMHFSSKGAIGIGVSTFTGREALRIDSYSGTRGLVLPYVTTAQMATLTTSLNMADQGMIFYNTERRNVEIWDGTKFDSKGESGGGQDSQFNWNVGGNTITGFSFVTTTGYGKIGTNENYPIALVVNNQPRILIDQFSSINIGDNNALSGGAFSSIAIGSNNTINANRSITLGNNMTSHHLGAVLLGDWNGMPVTSSTINQFTGRFIGGYRFLSVNADNTKGLFIQGTNLGINISPPQAGLQVNGDVGLGDGTNAGNKPVVVWLTNASGGSVGANRIVIVSPSNDNSFTTTTTSQDNSAIGVLIEPCNNGQTCKVAVAGIVDVITLGSVVRGQHCVTSTVSGQATSVAVPSVGASIGVFLESGSMRRKVLLR